MAGRAFDNPDVRVRPGAGEFNICGIVSHVKYNRMHFEARAGNPMAVDPLHAMQTTTSSVLASAVRRVLRPLVGLLVEHGLTYQWMSGLLKSLFVDVAEKEFRLPGKRQTDSRITLLSGVHRKDVRRLRQLLKPGDPGPPENVYLGAHLVAIWTSERGFVDDSGRPKPLPRGSCTPRSAATSVKPRPPSLR